MRRGRGLLLAGLLLLGQAAGLAHLLFGTHVTCPEHGDLIHPREGLAAARVAGSAWYPLPAAVGSEHGEHCASALHQDDRSTPAAPVASAAPATPRALPCPGDLAADVVPTPRFRLAPKTSPPLLST